MWQSGLREAAREEVEAKTEKVTILQKRLVAKSAKLLLLSAGNGKLIDEIGRVESQHGTGATASNDPKSISTVCGRPAKRTK